jgi:dihydroorotate dehydrogenase (fumarate)
MVSDSLNRTIMINLTTKYLGLSLKNPIVAASSGLTDTVEKIIFLEKHGVGAVVLKSLFEEEILAQMDVKMKQMVSTSFIYPETLDYYDNVKDEADEDTLKYLKLIREAKANVKIPIIASINCVSAQNWLYFPRQLEEAGADAIELNLFILPSDFSRNNSENEKVYFDIIHQVLNQVKIPVSIKISPYFSDLGSMIKRLSETGIKGIVLFNRFYSPDIDINNLEVTPGFVMSHPAELALSLRWIALMSGHVDCDLGASTGIHSGADVIKQLLAGATVTEVASTLYKNGFGQIETMLNELAVWMVDKKYKSIEDFRGKLSHKNVKNPASYERMQFIKNFKENKSKPKSM